MNVCQRWVDEDLRLSPEVSASERNVIERLQMGQPLKMGSLNKAQRLATLQSLIDRGYLDSRCRPTKKGIENSGPRFWKDGR